MVRRHLYPEMKYIRSDGNPYTTVPEQGWSLRCHPLFLPKAIHFCNCDQVVVQMEKEKSILQNRTTTIRFDFRKIEWKDTNCKIILKSICVYGIIPLEKCLYPIVGSCSETTRPYGHFESNLVSFSGLFFLASLEVVGERRGCGDGLSRILIDLGVGVAGISHTSGTTVTESTTIGLREKDGREKQKERTWESYLVDNKNKNSRCKINTKEPFIPLLYKSQLTFQVRRRRRWRRVQIGQERKQRLQRRRWQRKQEWTSFLDIWFDLIW